MLPQLTVAREQKPCDIIVIKLFINLKLWIMCWFSNRYKKPTRDRSQDDLTQLDDDASLISNLPRLTFPEQHLNNNDRNGHNSASLSKKCFRIDCMDMVWSMAFGFGISSTNGNIWTRFHFKRDLILATGLQGGTIKLWDVYKGTCR